MASWDSAVTSSEEASYNAPFGHLWGPAKRLALLGASTAAAKRARPFAWHPVSTSRAQTLNSSGSESEERVDDLQTVDLLPMLHVFRVEDGAT